MNFKTRFFIFFAIAASFIFIGTKNSYADTNISLFTLNGSAEDMSFNPQSGEKMTIGITTNTPVKFNTIAICSLSDEVCSRTTAVKYFTQTSSYSSSVSKDWDGKSGGSSPDFVAEGIYKVNITMADESGGSYIETGQHSITIDNSLAASDSGGTSDTGGASGDLTGQDASSSQDNSANSAKTVVRTVYISTHSDPADLSDFSSDSSFITSAGRERVAYVGVPVEFAADYKADMGAFAPNFRRWTERFGR